MPGELVGEMVIFHPDAKRSATIVSHAPGLIATMLVSEFEALVEELPEVGSKFMRRRTPASHPRAKLYLHCI